MQIDMHYYGTYAMARAAGLKPQVCKTIATAAQFVDDNADKESIRFRDGARLDAEATAHHTLDIKNTDLEDQRKIWVPFHFLPGNEGSGFTERLICRKDKNIVKKMVDFNLSHLKEPYGVLLIGITAHVYADTFSHYGFSGISSRRNKIKDGTIQFIKKPKPSIEKYIREKEKRFRDTYKSECGTLDNIKSWFAENLSGALGHGAAVTFPDRPYLVWEFEYEDPEFKSGERNNPKSFLEGCKALYDLFRKAALGDPELAEKKYMKFAAIEGVVKDVLATEADKKGRINAWRRAARSGKLFQPGSEKIPAYDGNAWHNQKDNLRRKSDSKNTESLTIYQYYQAASIHRNFVLRDLLPSKGLIVT